MATKESIAQEIVKAAQALDFKKVGELRKQALEIERQEFQARVDASKTEIQGFAKSLTNALGGIKGIPSGFQMTGKLSNGELKLQMVASDPAKWAQAFHDIYPEDLETPELVKYTDFTVGSGGKVVVETHTRGTGGGGGGSGGKGWVKDGQSFKLGAVFDAHANAEDRKALTEAESRDTPAAIGSAVYAVKKKVALREKYSLAS